MPEQEQIPTDEEAERELEEAEKAFEEENKTIAAQQSGEPTKEETAKKYQNILIALGFTRYDNKEKGIACKLKAGQLLIGRTFTEQCPIGNMWVQCLSDGEHGKKGEFLKRGECKQIPQVNLFYLIRDGLRSIPGSIVTGEVVGKSEKAVQIQFDEFGLDQYETQWWGFGALKKNEEGINYVPASYSKETEKYTAKMQVPRDIILKDYEAELEGAPLTTQTDTTKEKTELPKKPDELAKTDLQPTEKGTLAEAIIPQEPIHILGEPTEYTEAIAKYTRILADVTEAIFAEDRIPSREKGYGVKFVYYSVVGENKKYELSDTAMEGIAKAILNAKVSTTGGDHEEQA